jgi:phosphatidylglycerophosphate synthase
MQTLVACLVGLRYKATTRIAGPPMSRPTFALLNLALIFGAAFWGMRAFARTRPDTSAVQGSRLLGSSVRAWYYSNLDPFVRLFAERGVKPMAITYAQIAASLLTALAYAVGLIYTAGFLVLFTGTLDILDGKVARLTNGDSRRGAFLDSVIDRYAEFFGYVGLIIFFGAGWRVWATLFAVLGGMMVSYTRARAEGLGVRCEVGLLQRPERFVLLGLGSIFSSIVVHVGGGDHELLAAVVLALAVLSNITAVQRIVHTSRTLSAAADG